MYKSLCVLFFVIHFVNCMNDCDHYDYDDHLGNVDYSNISVISLPDGPSNFIFGPIYDSETGNGYVIDFISPNGTKCIYRFEYATQRIIGATVPGKQNPSFIAAVKGCNTEFVVGFDGEACLVRWDGVSETAFVIRTLFTAYGHMNYALADKSGRLYFGTVNSSSFCAAGADKALYRYDKGNVTKLIEGLKTSTSMTFDFKRNKFYHMDSCNFRIVQFDYDPQTGDICNPRVVYDFTYIYKPNSEGIYPFPLGMVCDTKGRLYVGLFSLGQVWIINSKTSEVLAKFNTTSPGVSGIAFGGPDLNAMFIDAAKIIVDGYSGRVVQYREQDATFFSVSGLEAQGFGYPRVCLEENYACSA